MYFAESRDIERSFIFSWQNAEYRYHENIKLLNSTNYLNLKGPETCEYIKAAFISAELATFTFLQCNIFRRLDSRKRRPCENEFGLQNLNFLPVTTIHLTLMQGFPPCWSFVAAAWEIAGPFSLQFKRSKGTPLK